MIGRTVLVALAVLCLAAPAMAARRSMNDRTAEIMARSIDDHVRPGYFYFRHTTGDLSASLERLCEAPAPGTLTKARDAFARVVVAWAEIETIGFGPITARNRRERVLFFPDPRGTALRQLQAMVASGEFPSDLAALQSKSVAVQGLPALEFVLYGPQAEDLAEPGGAAPLCAFGRLVAANLSEIARTVEQEWSDPEGIVRVWTKPGPDNPVLRSAREALVALLGVQVHGMEMLRDVRLAAFLGETSPADRPGRALFRRSGLTLRSVRADLEGLRNLFDSGGMALALEGPDRAIARRIGEAFDEAIALAVSLEDPVEALLSDPGARARLVALRDAIARLKTLLNRDFGNAVGLTAGFSFADGD